MPDGEARKNLDAWRSLVEGLLAQGIDRKSAVVALGGGVVGDVAGFAAATVLRGVPLVHVPTSLVAMVDSSVGGKTGVNAAGGKNLVGAFHQPRLVYAALHTLDTLPRRELLSGARGGREARPDPRCRALRAPRAEPRRMDPQRALMRELVERSVRVKAAVNRRRRAREGVRVVLNFGHTVGHALEVTAGGASSTTGNAWPWACWPRPAGRWLRGPVTRRWWPGSRRSSSALGFPTAPPPIDGKALETAAGIDKKVAHGILANRCHGARRMGAPRPDSRSKGKQSLRCWLVSNRLERRGEGCMRKRSTAASLVLAALPGCTSNGVHANPDDLIQVNPETITIQGGKLRHRADGGTAVLQGRRTGKLWFIVFYVARRRAAAAQRDRGIGHQLLRRGLAIIPPSAGAHGRSARAPRRHQHAR
jgi:3-dehydroquinate synthase